jgi:hypothetical protein
LPRRYGLYLSPAIFAHKYLILLVPGERFELPTNGLQNRRIGISLPNRP